MKKTILFCIPLMIVAACHSAGSASDENETSEVKPVAEDARTEMLGGNTIDVERISSRGRILSKNTIPVCSLVDGVVNDFKLVEGDSVTRGQVLMRIDDTELRMEISELESELAQKNFDVETSLIGLGYKREDFSKVTPEVRDNAETIYGYKYTRTVLENKRKLLEKYVVRAPFSGRLLNVEVSKNCYADTGETLFYLMDTEHLRIEFSVLETDIESYEVGAEMEFSTLAYGDEVFKARLTQIAPNVEKTGTIVMYADVLEINHKLRPGMTVFINLAD